MNKNNNTAQEPESSSKKSYRSFRREDAWYFQLAEGLVLGPFDKVFDTVMKDREFEERELDKNETTRLMLQFA